MNRISRLAVATATVLLAAACAENAPLAPELVGSPAGLSRAPEEVVEGEFIVRLADNAEASAVARENNLQVAETLEPARHFVMRGSAGNERARALQLRRDPRIVYAEPNYLRKPTLINGNLWAFRNPGGLTMNFTTGKNKGRPVTSFASVYDADQDNIENYASGGAPVVIGSIDTGVDFAHPEFTGRLIAGRDWYSNDNNPTDEDGHGTHTTGTMAGSSVGVAGVAGAASNVTVYVQRVCGRRGCPTSAIVNAIRAAADYPGMVAINMSLGGTSESQAEKDAIAYATSKGVLVIASAGNDGVGTVACPACDPLAISVSATDWRDGLASYSQYGNGLDIAAPGGQCYSNTTAEGCIYSAYKGGTYAWMQGTSMAAPQVTGTAAIVASVTGLRGLALRERLLTTADAKTDVLRFGAGRLNSYRAVTGNTLPDGQ
jgi:subtilisin family serine protease